MCQFGWQLLIVHGRKPRLLVHFDKVNDGPTKYSIKWFQIYIRNLQVATHTTN